MPTQETNTAADRLYCKSQVDELFQEVESSELSPDLRRNLLELLEIIRQQISQFQIRGVTALHECLRQSLARLMEIYPAFHVIPETADVEVLSK